MRTELTSVEVAACPDVPGAGEVLTDDAVRFVLDLHRRFATGVRELLLARREPVRWLDFPRGTAARAGPAWRVPAPPADLTDRRVEITASAAEARVAIDSLNSGAGVWVADLEDSTAPTWSNMVASHRNLHAAVAGTLNLVSPAGRRYVVKARPATIMVRPRGLHLTEHHVRVAGTPVPACIVDFGLFAFHCARGLLERGSGPYAYLPKLRTAAEARWWAEVFAHTEEAMRIPPGSIRAAVLVEDIQAAFEMPEILFELRRHALGLTAGRWDYLFSMVRAFREDPEFVLAERARLTMNVPFLRAYTELLVRTCHAHGAQAIGGLAAWLPDRHAPEANAYALTAIGADKAAEAAAGFDGCWVAHPDSVPVCRSAFPPAGTPPRSAGAAAPVARRQDLLPAGPAAEVPEAALRAGISVSLRYLESWLRGRGSVPIDGLMESLATVEIARSQIWQWVRHRTRLDTGAAASRPLVYDLLRLELARVAADTRPGQFDAAARLLARSALTPDYPDHLTDHGYPQLVHSGW